jgi:hypothetical protein
VHLQTRCAPVATRITLTAADFVRGGGAYLGLCAGAYYATARVVFEPGTPMEVVGDRALAFFPGIGRGCAFPGEHSDWFQSHSTAASTARLCTPDTSAQHGASICLCISTTVHRWPLPLQCNMQSLLDLVLTCAAHVFVCTQGLTT